MQNIYFPAAFAQDPVVAGPLLTPINTAQQATYDKAIETNSKYDQYNCFYIQSVIARIGHNLHVVGRCYMPFANGVCAEDTVKPYATWSGYTHLIIVYDSTVRSHTFGEEKDYRYREEVLRRNLAIWRSCLSGNMHHLDREVITIGADECVDQIDCLRTRQRKRREPR